jgi:hypothetical protein
LRLPYLVITRYVVPPNRPCSGFPCVALCQFALAQPTADDAAFAVASFVRLFIDALARCSEEHASVLTPRVRSPYFHVGNRLEEPWPMPLVL